MSVFKANPTITVSNGNKWNMISAVRAGALAVDDRGSRFMNEAGGYIQSLKIWAQPDHKCWLIFGDPVVKTVKRLAQLMAEGSVIAADNIEELARKTGTDAETLTATLAAWEKAVKSGRDPDFGRKGLKNGFGGKLYAVRIEPMIQGTFGGVKTNVRTEAFRKDGSIIPGLYAVGECASVGLRGVNPQTANIVFGSLAGRNAARYAKTAA